MNIDGVVECVIFDCFQMISIFKILLVVFKLFLLKLRLFILYLIQFVEVKGFTVNCFNFIILKLLKL